MADKYLRLADVHSYIVAFQLSNDVWRIVVHWEIFSRKTVGEQWVRSIDSVSANIAEGFGRYSKKDKVKFYRYALGSVYESLDWLQKSHVRQLLQDAQYQTILQLLQSLPKEINSLIQYTNSKLKI